MLTLLYVFTVVMLASLLQALTGFGFALLATPLLTLVLPIREVVMLVLVTSTLVIAVMVCRNWRQGKFSRLYIILTASIVGMVPGIYALRVINDQVLKSIIGVVLIISALATAGSTPGSLRCRGMAKTAAGLLSGFLGITTGLNGPPVVLYMMSETRDKELVRANLACFFLTSNCAAVLLAYSSGLLHPGDIAVNVTVAIPAIVIGYWLGNKIFAIIDFPTLRQIGLTLVLFSGVVMLGLRP